MLSEPWQKAASRLAQHRSAVTTMGIVPEESDIDEIVAFFRDQAERMTHGLLVWVEGNDWCMTHLDEEELPDIGKESDLVYARERCTNQDQREMMRRGTLERFQRAFRADPSSCWVIPAGRRYPRSDDALHGAWAEGVRHG